MITPDDIRNPARQSGFKHVNNASGGGQPARYWRATQQLVPRPVDRATGKQPGHSGSRVWRGPARKDPLQAAQDYCDYVNGQSVTSLTLKTAGHAGAPKAKNEDPKVTEARALLREARAADDPKGYVYLIGEVGGEYAVKVGKSKDHPRYRLAGLQTGNARLLTVLGFIETDDRHTLERELHAKYANLNILQEWFEPDEALLAEFSPAQVAREADKEAA